MNNRTYSIRTRIKPNSKPNPLFTELEKELDYFNKNTLFFSKNYLLVLKDRTKINLFKEQEQLYLKIKDEINSIIKFIEIHTPNAVYTREKHINNVLTSVLKKTRLLIEFLENNEEIPSFKNQQAYFRTIDSFNTYLNNLCNIIKINQFKKNSIGGYRKTCNILFMESVFNDLDLKTKDIKDFSLVWGGSSNIE